MLFVAHRRALRVGRLWCVYELSEFVLLHRRTLNEGDKLQFVGLEWPAWWNPFNWVRTQDLSEHERQTLKNFSCRAARCYSPADRAYILGEIRRKWGSEEVFDKWMHAHMPDIVLMGKREYMGVARRAVKEAAEFLFSSMG